MEATAHDVGEQRRCRVLIVEDNERGLKLFRLIINSIGCKAFGARNGEEGVRMAREVMPNLILMDIQMPVMDGVTAVDILKSNGRTKDIPVIALTSYAMRGDKERLLRHGFVDYIAKPISKDGLINTVKRVLGESMFLGSVTA